MIWAAIVLLVLRYQGPKQFRPDRDEQRYHKPDCHSDDCARSYSPRKHLLFAGRHFNLPKGRCRPRHDFEIALVGDHNLNSTLPLALARGGVNQQVGKPHADRQSDYAACPSRKARPM